MEKLHQETLCVQAGYSPETGEKGFEFQNIGKIAAPSPAGKQLEPGEITPLENNRNIPVFMKRKRRRKSGGPASYDRSAFHPLFPLRT